MRGISKEEAVELLEPYIYKIKASVLNPINDYFTNPALTLHRQKLSKRSDASNCHDLIVDQIKMEFEQHPRTRLLHKNKVFFLIVEERVLLRFKLFDHKNLGRSINTIQSTKLNNQEIEQLELENMPPDGLLHVGYCINTLRTGVDNICVTYRQGDQNLWEWDLLEGGSNNVKQIEIFPHEQPMDRKRKPRPKTDNVGEIVNGNNH
ncbi:hypothetical protein IDH44_13690 [Paenibacillus sp. IB182496]|uniref:Uncharacterized protein n=1 Tax=Paenibacillus sabuli TaxID=2772509 RepID=A0A927BT15_9BACL|nr:hypothetical protein [Paenibacillus sabuli]MBD2846253.1 hypothetical protein [Paenibacillus sabuli]